MSLPAFVRLIGLVMLVAAVGGPIWVERLPVRKAGGMTAVKIPGPETQHRIASTAATTFGVVLGFYGALLLASVGPIRGAGAYGSFVAAGGLLILVLGLVASWLDTVLVDVGGHDIPGWHYRFFVVAMFLGLCAAFLLLAELLSQDPGT